MSANAWEVPPHPESDDAAAWIAWAGDLEVNRLLGLRMTGADDDGATFVVESGVMRNSRDDLHGGLLLAIADQCAGMATKRGVPGRSVLCATASVSAQFLRPASVPLTVDARVTKHGRRLAFVSVEEHDAGGAVCLHAQFTLSVQLG